MNLILFEPGELSDTGKCRLSDRRARHILDILHATAGRKLRAGILNGPVGNVEVVSVQDAEVELRFEPSGDIPPVPPVDLLLALPRPKVMRRLWPSLAQIGVGRIILTNAAKVERFYFDSHVLDPVLYRALLVEGLEQAMDTRLPEVTIHRQLKVLLEDELDALIPAGRRMIADPRADSRIGDAIRRDGRDRVVLAVGPEGGWTLYELNLFKERGFISVAISPRILRADTACIALLSLLHDALNR